MASGNKKPTSEQPPKDASKDVLAQVAQYQTQRHSYQSLAAKLEGLLIDLMKHQEVKATIEARAKEVESFRGKLERKSYTNPLAEVTDLCGLRIIANSLQDVKKIVVMIRQEFEIDEQRSVDKATELAPDQFRYLSKQYIIRIKPPRTELMEWADLKELYAEVQVRTALQHAWAVIEHPLNYKTEVDTPKELQRRLFRLSALFELADQELDAIINAKKNIVAEYTQQIQQDELDVEFNVDSWISYLNSSETVQKIVVKYKKLGSNPQPIENSALSFSILTDFGINSLRHVDELLQLALTWDYRISRLGSLEFRMRAEGPYFTATNAINVTIDVLMIGLAVNTYTLGKEYEKYDPRSSVQMKE